MNSFQTKRYAQVVYFQKAVNIRFWEQYNNKFKLSAKSPTWINFERKTSWPRTRIPSFEKVMSNQLHRPFKKNNTTKSLGWPSKEHSEEYLDFSKMYDIFCDVLLVGAGLKRKLDGRRGG